MNFFKKANINNEIELSFENNLTSNTENAFKLANIALQLKKAEKFLIKSNLYKQAKEVANLSVQIVDQDPAIKGLTPDKMVNNLKEKGWVFNADDHEWNYEDEDEFQKAELHMNQFVDNIESLSYSELYNLKLKYLAEVKKLLTDHKDPPPMLEWKIEQISQILDRVNNRLNLK